VLDVALQVEVGVLAVGGSQDGLQLGVGVDGALVLGVLQLVLLDVHVQQARHVGAGQLGALALAQEGAHVVGQEGGLGKAAGYAGLAGQGVAVLVKGGSLLALALAGPLGLGLHQLDVLLLQRLQHGGHLLDHGHGSGQLLLQRGETGVHVLLGVQRCGSAFSVLLCRGGGFRFSLSLLGSSAILLLLLLDSLGGRSGGRGFGGSGLLLFHFGLLVGLGGGSGCDGLLHGRSHFVRRYRRFLVLLRLGGELR